MSGSKEGGLKARETNKRLYGADYYAKIGGKGGAKTGIKKGFAVDNRTWLDKILGRPSQASRAGKKGGTISKRRPRDENV